MKKVFAYTITAVLLGSVIMLSPLQLFYVSHGEEGVFTRSAPYIGTLDQSISWGKLCCPETYGYPESVTPPLDAEKVATQPNDPFIGALGLSFFVALIAYLLFRRRRPEVPYRHSQYFLRS